MVRWPWQAPTVVTAPSTSAERSVPVLPAFASAPAEALTASAGHGMNVLAASAAVKQGQQRLLIQTGAWQNEVWNFYDNLGAFRFAVDWHSNAISRVRLRAAKIRPGQDEPEVSDVGTAAELVSMLGGDAGGRSQLMKTFVQLLDVPGECWLIGEDTEVGEKWSVRSADEIKATTQKTEVIDTERSSDGQVIWRPLQKESMIVRIWRPHARYKHMADSPARSARSTMRELELVDRKIQAQYLSRLASAGIVVFPDELSFPIREEFADDIDPFVSEWIATAREAIHEQGTAAAVVPIPMRVPAEYVDKVQFIDFTQKFDDKIIEKRTSAITKLATELDMPVEILLGTGKANHWCTTPDTEIMTHAHGWVHEADLNIGDVVLTLNHQTGMSEWQPVLDIYRAQVTDEPMVRIEGDRHTSLTTVNHRWPILSGRPSNRTRQWTTSGDLALGALKAGPDTQRQEYVLLAAQNADLPTEAKYSDALVETVAWYYTEGNKGIRPGRNTPQVVINQSLTVNPENCARIERALTALFGSMSDTLDKGGRYASPESIARSVEARALRAAHPRMPLNEIGKRIGVTDVQAGRYLIQEPKLRDSVPRWRLRKDPHLNRYVFNAAAAEVILEYAPGRVVSLEFIHNLTLAQLELFMAVSILGDGHMMGGTTPDFGQKNPKMCDAFELAAILTGRSTNRYSHTSLGISAHGPVEKTQEKVYVSNRRTTFAPRGRSFTVEPYNGMIWCPTTQNRTWLARREGTVYYTGNSAWAVEEAGIKIHIIPTVELICNALTTGYLYPRMRAANEDPTDWVIWYDTSELSLRPDKTSPARDAYDRIEISGKAFRRETGFDENDAPTDKERLEQILLQLTKMPTVAVTALNQLIPGAIDVSTMAPTVSGTSDKPVEPDNPRKSAHDRGMPDSKEKPSNVDDQKHDKTGKSPGAHAISTTIPYLVHSTDVVGHLLNIDHLSHEWTIKHPKSCEVAKHQCPVSWAGYVHPGIAPGTSGTYALSASPGGALVIGERVLTGDNGHVSSRVR